MNDRNEANGNGTKRSRLKSNYRCIYLLLIRVMCCARVGANANDQPLDL